MTAATPTRPIARPASRPLPARVLGIVVAVLGVWIGPRLLPAFGPGVTAGPTFNVPAAMTAQVDMAGETRDR